MAEPDFVSMQTHDARRFYLDLDPSCETGLTVVCGGDERMNANYEVDRSDFPYFAIEWVSDGRGLLTIGGSEFELSMGSLFAYGPGVAHRIRNMAPNNMRKHYLDLAGKEAESELRSLGLLGFHPVTIGRPFELVELWNLIDREAREAGPHAADICASLTRALFQKIRQRKVGGSREVTEAFHTYESIRQVIEERFLEFRTIEDVAAECGFSPIYLSRLFKRFAGTGAYRFLLRLRMNHAAELLLERKMLVRKVAAELEYADAFQFSRAFKRVYGVAPSNLHLSKSIGTT